VKKTPTKTVIAKPLSRKGCKGDFDPELLSKQGRRYKIKNPQWIASQVVFLSQVWSDTGSRVL